MSSDRLSTPAASAFEAAALERLKGEGLRVTGARVAVLRALFQSPSPMSPSQLHQKVVSSGGHIDMVSVYRVLTTLQKLGLVHHVGSIDAYSACRFEGLHESSTAHLVCQRCLKAEERPVSEETRRALLNDAKAQGFGVREMRIEVIGTCSTCQSPS